jgi:hypothetical protein
MGYVSDDTARKRFNVLHDRQRSAELWRSLFGVARWSSGPL